MINVNQSVGDRGEGGKCGSPCWRWNIKWLGAAHAFAAANNRAELCSREIVRMLGGPFSNESYA